MARFPEAEARIFRSIFVCKKCKTKIRAQSMKVRQGRVKCRRCNSKALRPVRKK
jgi:ribosomal protein L40E